MRSRSILTATAALSLILSLTITQVYASCTVQKYYPTRDYDFANGNMIFHYLDMDPSTPDVQDVALLSAGQNALAKVNWSWGPQCPGCRVYVGAFGSWSDAELVRLFAGVKGGRSADYAVQIPYKAPPAPGLYRLRVVFSYGAQVANFNATNLCAETQCEGGECNLLLAEGLVNVTNVSTEDSIPPTVRIIRPKGASVSGTVMGYIGEEIFIDALVDDPYAALSVIIDGAKVAEGLPYGLNTTNLGEGLYRVVVTAVDKAQHQGQDEVFIQLINRSQVTGRQPLELWSTSLESRVAGMELSRDGGRVAVVEEPNTLHLLDGRGAELWSFSTPGGINALSMSGDGEYLAIALEDTAYVLREDGSIAWNYTAPALVNALSMSGNGETLGLAVGTVIYALGNGSTVWNFTANGGVNGLALSEDGGLTALAVGREVYILGRYGLLEWNYTLPEGINSISMSEDGTLVAVAAGNNLYALRGREGSVAWNYTAPAVVTATALSGNGELLVMATGSYITLLGADGEPLSSLWVGGGASSIRLSSSGEYIAFSSGNRVRYFHNPKEVPVALYMALLALALAGLVLWRMKGIRLPREITLERPKEPEVPTPEVPPLTVKEEPRKVMVTEPKAKPSATGELRLRVTNAVSGGAISGATATIDGDRARTDAKGEALFERLPLRAYRVTVASPLFEPQGREYALEEEVGLLEIKLAPVAKLTPEQQERLQEAVNSLRTRFEQFATFDTCIPSYYRSVGDRLTDFVVGLSGRPEYFLEVPERYSVFMEELVGMVETVCKSLSEIMGDWKNIMLYKATTDLSPVCCTAPPVELGEDIPPFIRDPDAYTRRNFRVVQDRLADVDSLITAELEHITILPVSSLWKVSDGLLSRAREERGVRKAVLVMSAAIVLAHVQDMMKRQDVQERLKRGII